MKFIKVFLWEFVQNVPLVAGFILALPLWQQARWLAAIAFIVAGSVVGSLVIHVTESKIVEGHREPLRVTITNIVLMSGLMIILVAYFSAEWSDWKSDLLVGGLLGLILGAGQDLAAREPIGVRHCLALACAFPLGIVGMRLAVASLPILVSILLIAASVTLVIGFVDYQDAFAGGTT